MADYSSLDSPPALGLHDRRRRRSAATIEVAKLIDVSKCIGCKACQSACLEWNDLRDDIGVNTGTYENPHDLTPKSWTLMRFTEYENPETNNLEWLIRKDGCMHCADPGCLKACPSPGAIVQYSNGIVDFIQENCIGCGYCVKGCPFNIPRISQDRSQGLQVHALLGPGGGRSGPGLRQGLPDRPRSCSAPRRP
jgi:formate dehydrogenase iron-sulfur subunit